MLRVLLLVFVICSIDAAKLPSYISQCSKSDPKLKECVIQYANLAIPLLAKGDIHYNLPSLLPLKLAEVILIHNEEFQLIMRDVEVYGLENANMTDTHVDLVNNYADFTINIPTLRILAAYYEMKGRLLNNRVYGSGFANITLVNGVYIYAPKFVTIKTNAFDEHYEYPESETKYETKRTMFYFENLFSVDFFGYDMNEVINQNWKEMSAILKPAATKILGDVIDLIVKNIAKVASVDEYFKE